MATQTHENLTTKRILRTAAAAVVLAGVGIRMNQLNNADDLGRAQQRADNPAHISTTPHGVEANK